MVSIFDPLKNCLCYSNFDISTQKSIVRGLVSSENQEGLHMFWGCWVTYICNENFI